MDWFIGLNGTGDGSGAVVDKSLRKMLQKLGIGPEQEISSSNIASVIVTAKLPAFARVGQKIDATVSSIGQGHILGRRNSYGHPHERRKWRDLRHCQWFSFYRGD